MIETLNTHTIQIDTYNDGIYKCDECGSEDIVLPVFYDKKTNLIYEVTTEQLCKEFDILNQCYCNDCGEIQGYRVRLKTKTTVNSKVKIDKFDKYEGKVI